MAEAEGGTTEAKATPDAVILDSEDDSDMDSSAERSATSSTALTAGPQEEAPEWGALWFVCALLGVGFLVPWHAVITAVDYFVALFPTRAVQFDVVVAYSLPNAVTFVLAVRWADRVPVRVRIVLGFVVFFVILVLLPVLDMLGSLRSLYFLLIALVALVGIVDGWVQSGIYAYASLLSARHVVAVQTGMGASGLAVAVARIASKALLGAHVGSSEAHVYFGVGAAAMVACILAFELTRPLPHAQRALRLLTQAAQLSVRSRSKHKGRDPESPGHAPGPSRVALLRKGLWAPCLFTFLTLLVTIAVYPGVVSEIKSPGASSDNGWLTLALMTLYNLCDLLAKFLPRWPLFLERVPPRLAYSLALLRLLLVPLFVLCVKPRFLTALAWPVVLTALLALTNGYLGSYFFALTPALVSERERDAAMTLLIAALVCGLAAGSFVGYGLSAWLR